MQQQALAGLISSHLTLRLVTLGIVTYVQNAWTNYNSILSNTIIRNCVSYLCECSLTHPYIFTALFEVITIFEAYKLKTK